MNRATLAAIVLLGSQFAIDTVAAGSGGHAPVPAPAPTAVERPGWMRVSDESAPPRRNLHAMAYDSARQRVVLFGGGDENRVPLDDTWEWDGGNWVRRAPLRHPSARCRHTMAYDAARGQVLLFGGETSCAYGSSGAMSDLWAWDGAEWTELHPPGSVPPTRSVAKMAYDPVRAEVMLLVGTYGLDPAETWTWDGTSWTRQTPASSPRGSLDSLMAYDAPTDRMLFTDGSLWEWDGAARTWSFRSDSGVYTNNSAMTGTASGVLLYGSLETFDTFKWDGLGFQFQPTTRHPTTSQTVMAYDSARDVAVAFGGQTYLGGTAWRYGDTWEWDGSDWNGRTEHPAPSGIKYVPTRTSGIDEARPASMVYAGDRHRVLFFGGDLEDRDAFPKDVWSWDGHAWSVLPCATSPGVHFPVVAYDEDRGRAVLFGGRRNTDLPYSQERTWEWDGADWVERFPSVHPPSRWGHATAYDRARHWTIIIGGAADTVAARSDTWTWDGSNWTERPSVIPARIYHALAYDARRQRVVLFGGCTDQRCLTTCSDTREWDGSNWTAVPSEVTPPARYGHVMSYDEARGRVVLHGGFDSDGNAFTDTWEWDGVNWERRELDRIPSPASGTAMAYDRDRARNVLFLSTRSPAEQDAETWEYGLTETCAQATSVESFSPGTGTAATDVAAALGEPDGLAVSLGLNGALVLRVGPIADAPGRDLMVYARGAAAGAVDENFAVEVSEDGVSFERVGVCAGGPCPIDLHAAGATTVAFVRVTDLPPAEAGASSPYQGVDIDAVTVRGCEPEVCNDLDDDGDGLVDEGCDDDGDDFCESGLVVAGAPAACPAGAGDCNDADASTHPGATESCNTLDDNCDGWREGGPDADQDGIVRDCDNCPQVANPGQEDLDRDSIGNACDNCPSAWNALQQNQDQDPLGDACDNCPGTYNYQEDFERDGVGDACDNCPYDANRSQTDCDGDLVGDVCDSDDGLIMQFRTEPGWIEWQAEAGYSSFNVYEGDLAHLRSAGTYTQLPGSNPLAQRTCGVLVPYLSDSDAPPAGAVQFSLVSGIVGGVEGDLGTDSRGRTRTNSNPCP